MKRNLPRVLWVVLFATAMAWMEAATVIYLRTLVGRLEPYQIDPLPLNWRLGAVEVIREAATLLMLTAVGWLAGRDRPTRFAGWALAFGIWDLGYYLFLALIGPWPRSVWDWDILFLIPLPWWGPVLAPVSIAALMAAGGTLVLLYSDSGCPVWPGRRAWRWSWIGAGLGLAAFMADALVRLPQGGEAIRTALPDRFAWWLFLPAWLLMAAPVGELWLRLRSGALPTEAVAAAQQSGGGLPSHSPIE